MLGVNIERDVKCVIGRLALSWHSVSRTLSNLLALIFFLIV